MICECFNILNIYKLLLVNYLWLILWGYKRKIGNNYKCLLKKIVRNLGKIRSIIIFNVVWFFIVEEN